MTQIRPLLLAILNKFAVKEAKESLRSLVSSLVRFLVVGGAGSGTLENFYSSTAKDVNDGKMTNAKGLIGALKKVVPGDAEFKEAFKRASVSKEFLARYYLRVLEQQSAGNQYPELVLNDNQDMVWLEDVITGKPSKG